jgi:cell division protein FtsN
MSKDYKNRIPAYRQRKQQRTRQFALGAAAAAAIAVLAGLGVFYLTRGDDAAPPPEPAAETPATGANGKSAAKGKTPPAAVPEHHAPAAPRFSFYKVLPEKEVIISESEIKTLKREESLGKGGGTGYLVQAGSFTSQQDAEKLKARLAGLNVRAKLEMIKLENTVWYRVKLGPYGSLADADKVRAHLRTNKIDSVVQQAKVAR